MEHLQFPVGRFKRPNQFTPELKNKYITTVKNFYNNVAELVQNLDQNKLKSTYRPGGWNVTQLIHHVADSHFNAFSRFKLALTEDSPTIKPYNEAAWASQIDYETAIEPSLQILNGVHARWSTLLEGMTLTDFEKEYIHPEYNKKFKLKDVLSLYDWHCRHHLAHIKLAISK